MHVGVEAAKHTECTLLLTWAEPSTTHVSSVVSQLELYTMCIKMPACP